MREAFDTGPLSWVKEEIDQSLVKVLASFNDVKSNPSDYASLRFTIAHLYQVSGALDMVGLEGCKRYCSEIEKLTDKLAKQVIPVTDPLMQSLVQSVETLSHYLQDLMDGAPDISTRLYATLKPLVEAQGEMLEESELFFPDTDYSAPKDLSSQPIEESAVPAFVSEQRALFQKSLLDWLRTKNAQALAQMRQAVQNVQQIQSKSAAKTLWWTATAFADTLNQEKVAGNAGAKKLCSRLDRQLKNMSLGESKVPSQLLRDLLYYVAISDRKTDAIAKVKEVFELDEVLPLVHEPRALAQALTDAEKAALAQLLADISSFKDSWTTISSSDVNKQQQELASLLARAGNAITTAQQALKQQEIIHLFNGTHSILEALQVGVCHLDDVSLIEVASALNLLEHGCQHYQALDADALQKILIQTARLESVINGESLTAAAEAFVGTGHHDASLVEAVVKQIVDALAVVEKALDTYFRNPADASILDGVAKPLQEISAAFYMLEMPVPASIAQLSGDYVAYFRNNNAGEIQAGDQSSFELLAESLSMLGLLAEELPNARVESERALSGALQRLQQGAQALGLADELEESSVEVTAETSNEMSSVVVDEAQTAAESVVDQALDAELESIFLAEAEEVLATLAQNSQTLRVNATDSEALAEVRRAYHTLKGSGRTVGLVALGEVAWAVESLLNLVIEKKLFPTLAILAFVEGVNAQFASWVAELQQNKTVSLNPKVFQEQAAKLAGSLEQVQEEAVAKPQKEEVLIAGTRKLSRAFFDIFIAEAQQHLQTLIDAQAALIVDSSELPTAESCRAAHTLGSNALTAGFKPIGDLARALEHWLDEHHGVWIEQHVLLYGNTVKALSDGLEKAKALKNPRSTRALVNALNASTATLLAANSQPAEASVAEVKKAPKKGKAKAKLEPQTQSAEVAQLEDTAQPVLVETVDVLPITEVEPIAPQKDAAVNQELLALFVEEARELVPQIGNDLRQWRNHPHEGEYPESLQRILHTLKGSARMAGQTTVGNAVHDMEDHVIRALKHAVTADDFDSMFAEFDHIGAMLEGVVSNDSNSLAGGGVANDKAPTRHAERKTQFLRMRADVLDRLINEAGEVSIMRSRMDREMQNFKQSSSDLTDSINRLRSYLRELEIEAETQLQSRMNTLQEANEAFDPLEFDRFTRLQELTRMMAESVNDVATIQHGLLLNLDQTDSALQQQNRMNRELQQGLMGVRMLPFSTISERLRRIVRQTARELGKQVDMTIDGEAVELDRGVLDKMGAPLEHLLRNAVAHGLETTDARIKAGKSEVGHIKLKVGLENDEITLVITDDGSGINLAKVRQKAIEKGIFTPEQHVTDQALMTVIFEPGFTTADSISQIAGRGVGLDAVRSDIASLGGRIDVNNTSGLGATFNVYLPVTLSVAQVVLMRAGSKVFAIPSVMVEQVQKLKQNDLMDAYQRKQLEWSGSQYPLHYLAKLIGDDQPAQPHVYTPVALLRSGTYRIALHVDEILGNQEVVMKPMGTQLAHVPGMIGATVMGDGAIIMVINPVVLANRDAMSSGAIRVSSVSPVVEQLKQVVLVVDDSLTMRKVLSRVLERENFEVVTANDGMDAIQKLQDVVPDIILTDIEMPRMDGFEFSRYVRDNHATAKTPLIIISSRTAEKHRNVATELGVSAFLGKPVQDDILIEQVKALLNP